MRQARVWAVLVLAASILGACSSDDESSSSGAGGAAGSTSAAGESQTGGSSAATGGMAAGAGGSTAGSGGSAAGSGGSTAGSGGSSAGSVGSPAGAGGSSGGSGGATAGTGSLTGGTGGAAGSGGSSAGSGGSGGVPPQPCDDTCQFVRVDATGNGDGSDWANAWRELPAALERGHRYFIADGDYPGYTFDDAASAETLITIQKATSDSHGTDVGWASEYGDGRARFGPLELAEPYYLLDGHSAAGIEVVAEFQGSAVDINADHVTIRQLDLNGNFGTDGGGSHNQGACTGLSISGSYVTVDSCEIHDVADDGVSISHSDNIQFSGNTVHALHACGTDGGCGPCYNGHSDGLETYNVKQSSFVGNFIYDVRSTATFFFGNWADSLGNGPSEYCEDILLANNIFYAPEVGLVAYLQDVAGIRVYHNVFWGVRQGGYGGLSIGQHVTDLHLYNNIILSINTAHTGGAFDPQEHHGDHNLYGVSLGQWTEGPNDQVATDPGFVGIPDTAGPAVADPTPGDFALTNLSPCVGAGYPGDTTVVLPTTDFFGTARDTAPDIGAIEQR